MGEVLVCYVVQLSNFPSKDICSETTGLMCKKPSHERPFGCAHSDVAKKRKYFETIFLGNPLFDLKLIFQEYFWEFEIHDKMVT